MRILLYVVLALMAGVGGADALFASTPVPEVAPPILGVVVDSAGRPLPGVQVVVEGTNRAALTGANGAFVFRSLAPGEYHLSASVLGYAPAHTEVTVPAEGGRPCACGSC
jgi:iron complex outermembrane receptor protein